MVVGFPSYAWVLEALAGDCSYSMVTAAQRKVCRRPTGGAGAIQGGRQGCLSAFAVAEIWRCQMGRGAGPGPRWRGAVVVAWPPAVGDLPLPVFWPAGPPSYHGGGLGRKVACFAHLRSAAFMCLGGGGGVLSDSGVVASMVRDVVLAGGSSRLRCGLAAMVVWAAWWPVLGVRCGWCGSCPCDRSHHIAEADLLAGGHPLVWSWPGRWRRRPWTSYPS